MGDAVARLGGEPRVAVRFRKLVAWIRLASVVSIGLAGCAHSAHQRASGWLVVETSNLQLRTNIPRVPAIRLAKEMQQAYDVLAGYALPCAEHRRGVHVHVTILPLWQYLQYEALLDGLYRRAAATWLPDHGDPIVVPADFGPGPRQAFLHEMTHRLVASCMVNAPPWLHEGLARFFETMLVQQEAVTFGRPAFEVITSHRARSTPSEALDGRRVARLVLEVIPALDRVFTLPEWRSHAPDELGTRYAAAWALVHFLVVGAPDLAPRFQAYLAELRSAGADPQRAFAKQFDGVPLQDRLNEYLLSGGLQMLKAPNPFGAPGERSPPRLRDLPEEEANLHLAWLSAHARDDESREQLQLHLAAAKQSPRTRSGATVVAAYALVLNGDLPGAEREIEGGLRDAAADPALLEAQLALRLLRKAGADELASAAERLRPVAKTMGAVCSLADAALRTGDLETARQLAARGWVLDPRRIGCQLADLARAAPP